MAGMTAKDYKKAIEDSAALALKEYPDNIEMSSRMFVAFLSTRIGLHDQPLSVRLDEVWSTWSRTEAGGLHG